MQKKTSVGLQRAILGQITDSIIVTDKRSKIIYWNHNAEKMYGWKSDEVIGKPFDLIAPTGFMPGMKRQWRAVMKKNNIWSGEVVQLKKDGSFLEAFSTTSLLKDSKGNTTGIVAVNRDISERRLVERQLQRSRHQLNVILQNIADGVTVQDKEGRFIYANDVAAKSMGFVSAEEMLSLSDKKLRSRLSRFHLKNQKGMPISVERLPGRKVLKGRKFSQNIIQYFDKNTHKTKWSLIKSRGITDEKGNVELAVNIMTDITERMQSEEALKFLAEASRVLSSSLDYQVTLNTVAQLAVANIADWSSVELINSKGELSQVAIYHKDEKKINWAKKYREQNPIDLRSNQGIAKVIKTGESEFYPNISEQLLKKYIKNPKDLKLLKKIGFTSIIMVPLTLGQRKTIGAITFASAESKRPYTQLDLRLAEQLADLASLVIENSLLYDDVKKEQMRLDNLVANVPGVVWESWGRPDKGKQKITFVSKYVEKMLGYSVDEWLQNPNFWQRIIHDDDCERMQRELKEIFDSGRRGVSRFRWVSKAGNALWVEAQSFVIKDSDENPIGMRGVVMDITERMEREERKDEFISMASHELRTPLTSIKVLTQVLRTKANTKDNEFLNYVEKINDQIFKLEHLVNDLLDVSKVQQGYLNLNKEKFNLYRLVEDVVESMQLVNPIHQISLKGNNNTRVYADKNRISQVIINLLTNAIKYSPNSTKIKINLEQEDGEISISVQDYGMGIPKKHLNRVFDRFYRVLDDKDKTYPGFGMGLYISREIIQRHGGNISVVSQVGKGSTFSFSLPVIDKNEKIVSS